MESPYVSFYPGDVSPKELIREKNSSVVVCHFLFQQKISRRANVVAEICLKSTVHTAANPGVFCNSAIKAAETDHDTVVQSILQTRKHFQKLVAELFRKIDTRGLGHLTITEFERHFDDHAVRAFFDYLQIGAIDAWTLCVSLAAWRVLRVLGFDRWRARIPKNASNIFKPKG